MFRFFACWRPDFYRAGPASQVEGYKSEATPLARITKGVRPGASAATERRRVRVAERARFFGDPILNWFRSDYRSDLIRDCFVIDPKRGLDLPRPSK